jgi:predicted  nucleic acid-binding Zn-ribbon protein
VDTAADEPGTHRRRALKADPAAQLALLDLQELDARTDLLRHQRAALPELAEIASLSQTRDELDGRRRDAQISVDDLGVEQRKVDADVEQVKARRKRDQDRMDQGLISNPKDLERMQGELESLQRRITSLEDDELEVMARLEDAQQEVDSLTAQVAEADERLAALTAARDEKTAELDRDLDQVAADRGPAVELIPADLLALYDKLRASKNGVAVGALRARECSGCRLSLDPTELAAIRAAAPDEVIRHDECQRILVRTPESGL